MNLQLDALQVEELMKSFYMLSGIRSVLFGTDFKEITSYPKESCGFCKLMKSCPKTRRKCNYADRRSFEKCEKENGLVLYKCHAGLVEAVMPLYENKNIIGYLMFGQITDNPDKTELYSKTTEWEEKCGLDREALELGIESITYKSESHIRAAAKIMEACTYYMILQELILPDSSKVLEGAKAYIECHLGENIEIENMCRELQVGRTKLYEIFRDEVKMGVSKYILHRRMHRAKKLLKSTDMSVDKIAESVGFADYNYFSRVFKKTYGKSPKSYRK